MIKLIMWELCGMAENCASVVTHLLELMAMYMPRTALRQSGGRFACHYAEDQIGKALELLRSQPEQPWTLSSLAAEVAMSRSAFAAHFRRAVGQTPMHFLTRERMRLAAKWIQEGNCKIGEIAERLDYHSEAAFQRAFKRHIGLTPGAIRRRSR
jgi:AraC-like DNA-binding protein